MRRVVLVLSLFLCVFASSAQIKVACVGNSVTYGSGISDPVNDSYPAQLQGLLGDGYVVEKFGRPGATLLFNGHNPYIKTVEYRGARDFGADIVVIHLGLNDTDPRNWPEYKDDFVGDYSRLIDSVTQNNPKARVIVARMSPIFERHKRFDSSTREWYYEVQGLIESVAALRGVELIDFQSVLNKYPVMLPDALHPNGDGAGLLARRVYSAITGDFGGLRMPILYTDNMVLQRGAEIVISGVANSGDKVRVELAGRKGVAVTSADGEWSVALSGVKTGSGYELKVSTKERALKYSNVSVGEVWLASGQSNMEWHLRNTIGGAGYVAEANHSDVRLFNMVPRYNYSRAWDSVKLEGMNMLECYELRGWQEVSSSSVSDFSAIAYHYACMLSDSLGVPVGVICNAVGGTTVESFVDRRTLEHSVPGLIRNWPENDYVMSWVRSRSQLNMEHGWSPLQRHHYEPAYLFEAGVIPLERYPIRGVIWYQGESNAHNIKLHEQLFGLLVQSWRANWGSPELPFYFVQLSSIANRRSWPEFRNSQRLLAKGMENVGMVVCSDLGDSTDVHPREKREVARRLAHLSLHDTYGMEHLTPSGPVVVSAQCLGRTVELELDYADGLHTVDGGAPASFEVAEFDGAFVPAVAEIVGNKIVLGGYVKLTPRFVRYGWQPYSGGNVQNSDKMPLSTFKIETKQ